MATQPTIYKFKDNQTGKIYQLQGVEGTTEDEALSYLDTLSPDDLPQYELKTPSPSPTAAPNSAAPAPTETAEDLPKQRLLSSPNQEEVVATRTLEEVPGAREFLEQSFRSGKSYEETRKEFETNPAFEGIKFNVGENTPAGWAKRKAFAATPEGQEYYANNGVFSTVNRPTGIADPEAPDTMAGEFGTSAKRSLAGMANTLTGLAGVGADIVGADETAQSLLDNYLEKQAAIAQNYPTSVGSASDIGSIHDAGMWASSVLGELLPQLTTSLTTGGLGGAAAKKAAERGVADFVEDRVASGVTREAAEAEAANLLRNRFAKGAAAGAVASSEAQEVGSIYGDTYGETGERAPWKSLLAGTAAASLDSVLPARLLGKIGGRKVEDAIVDSLIKKIGKEAASDALIEGGTEAIQEIIENLPAASIKDDYSDIADNVVEAFLRGSLGGSVAGGGTVLATTKSRTGPTAPVSVSIEDSKITLPKSRKNTKAYKKEVAETASGIAEHINTVAKDWKNPPKFEVHQNFKDMAGVDKDALGAIGPDGKIAVNAENVIADAKAMDVSVEDVVTALTFHEALGHHGMTQVFGKRLDGVLTKMYDDGPSFRTKVDNWLKKNPDAYLHDSNRVARASDEVLAEMSERGQLTPSLLNRVKNLIKATARKAGINWEFTDREIKTILGMAHTAVINGNNRDVRGNGFRYMNVGQRAKLNETRSLQLQKAKALDSAGADRITTFNRTGWWKDYDGEWKTRISDADSSLTSNPLKIENALNTLRNGGKVRLEDILDHSDLYEAYPFLRDINVSDNNWSLGAYSPSKNEISLDFTHPAHLASKENIRETLLHEIQHAIQTHEGFASGGNPEAAVKSLSDEEVVQAANTLLEDAREELIRVDSEYAALQNVWNDSKAKALRSAFDYMRKAEISGLDSTVYKSAAQRYDNLYKGIRDEFSDDDLFSDFLEKIVFSKNPDTRLRELSQEGNRLDEYIEDLNNAFASPEYSSNDLRSFVQASAKVKNEAYEWLLGEIEARETERLKDVSEEALPLIKPGTVEGLDPDYFRVSKKSETSASAPRELIERDRELRRKTRRENTEAEKLAAIRSGIDPESIGLPPQYASLLRYSKMKSREVSSDDIFESKNALDILNAITEDYTPVVMSLDDIRHEAELRGIEPARILRNKELELGQLPRRFIMHDIAADKLNDKVTKLYHKIQSGQATQKDREAHAKALLQFKELSARIFNEQGEAGRLLRIIQNLQYTKKKVTGITDALNEFTSDQLQEIIDDPVAYNRFATQIQEQMEEQAENIGKSKISEQIANVLNVPRALMSSADLSAPLRQGIFLIGRPEFWKSIPSMFKYLTSEGAYNNLMHDITNRENYRLMVDANVAFSSRDGKLSNREEAFQSELVHKIPVLGKIVNASERAYNGFLNKLRADTFDNLIYEAQEAGVDVYDQDFFKSLGSFINHATGRGNLGGMMNSAAPLLNALFFSPRLIASRAQLLNPQYYYSLDPFVRKQAVKSLLSTAGFVLTVLSLGALAGADTEPDPRSSDFGKLKVGDTRYDIPGGFAQYVTLGARLITGQTKNSLGIVKDYGNKYGQKTRWDALLTFLQNKFAPIPSFVVDALRGADAVGEPFDMPTAVASRFVPMFAQDVKEVSDEYGLGEGLIRSSPGLFGVGIQNYTPKAADPNQEVLPPDSFQMQELEDGENDLIAVSDGVVTLKGPAKEEWEERLNFYFQEWMKDEVADPEWKKKTLAEKADVIKEVKNDARKQTKKDMLPLLGIE